MAFLCELSYDGHFHPNCSSDDWQNAHQSSNLSWMYLSHDWVLGIYHSQLDMGICSSPRNLWLNWYVNHVFGRAIVDVGMVFPET